MTDAVISFNSDILETDLELTNGSYKVTPTNAISIHGGDDVFIAAEIGFGSGLQLLDEVRVEFFCTAMLNGQTVDTTIKTVIAPVLPEEGDPGVIYRFYNGSVNSHFYTMDFNEVIYLITENPNWNFEGEVYKAIPTATGGGCTTDQNAIYRFFNEGTTKHFYTDSPEEKDYLISTNPSWDYEGTAYCVPKQANPTDVPLYQFYSDVYGGHFYTIDPVERDWVISALANVYRYEALYSLFNLFKVIIGNETHTFCTSSIH